MLFDFSRIMNERNHWQFPNLRIGTHALIHDAESKTKRVLIRTLFS